MDEVILSCGFLSDGVKRVLGDIYQGMRLRYVIEEEPLGTAGPVRLALDEGLLEERLLVLNGDCLTDIDLTAELAQHERTGARATLALVAVEDTSSYGVVPTDEDGRVEAFLEKAEGEAPTNRINAGAYVLEREVVEAIEPGRAVSFEREVFPSLVGHGLYGYRGGRLLDRHRDARALPGGHLGPAGRPPGQPAPRRDETGSLVYPPCLVSGAHIGPQSVLGPHCSVGTDSTVERSVLHEGVIVGADCVVRESVLAERVRVGDGARIGPRALVGSGAIVDAGAAVEAEARIAPGLARGGRAVRERPAVAGGDRGRRPVGHARRRARPASAGGRRPLALRVGRGPAAGRAGRARGVRHGRLRDRRRPGGRGDRRASGAAAAHRARLRAAARRRARHAGAGRLATRATPRRRSRASPRPARLGAPRVALTTGGGLAESARAEGVPVIGVPSGMQPRAAVVYAVVGALGCAEACGAAPPLRDEIEARGGRCCAAWPKDDSRARELALDLRGRIPVIYGGGATAPVATRWKTQVNENAKSPAFAAFLPEAGHNEICAWERSRDFAAVFLEESGQSPPVAERMAAMAEIVAATGAPVLRIEAVGRDPLRARHVARDAR